MSNLSLFRRGYGRRKPGAWARLDGAHPLARGLVLCLLANENGGATLYDLCSPLTNAALTNQTWVPAANRLAEVAVQYNGSTTLGTITDNPARLNLGTGSAVVWVYSQFAGGTTADIIGRFVGSAAVNQFWCLSAHASKTEAFLGDGSSFLSWSGTGTLANDGLWHQVGLTWTGGSSAQLWLDGRADGSAQVLSFTPGTGSSVNVRLGLTGTEAVTWHGLIGPALVYNRALGAAEIKQLYDQPYCFLQAASSRQLASVPPPAAVVNTLGPVAQVAYGRTLRVGNSPLTLKV